MTKLKQTADDRRFKSGQGTGHLNTTTYHFIKNNHICTCGVLISVHDLNVVDRRFEHQSRSGQSKDYKIDICCLSAKYTALWSKSNHHNNNHKKNISNTNTNPTDFMILC